MHVCNVQLTNRFVVLSAEPGLAGVFKTYRIDDNFSDGALNDDEVLEDTVSRDRECSIRRSLLKHQV